MDRYITILLIKLTERYEKVFINSFMAYNAENKSMIKSYKLTIKEGKKKLCDESVYGKRKLVEVMAKWLN